MKKYQYSVGITFGVLAGGLSSLFVTVASTAIYVGIIIAGLTSWVISLDWSLAKKFHGQVVEKLSVEVGGLAEIFGKAIRFVLGILGCFCYVFVSLVVFLPRNLYKEKELRKLLFGSFFTFIIAMGVSIWYWNLAFGYVPTQKLLNPTPVISVFMGVTAVAWIVSLILAVMFLVLCGFVFCICCAFKPQKEASKSSKRSSGELFVIGWLEELALDDGNIVVSLYRMFKIRTGNALRLLLYPLVLVVWGFYALANNKTGLCSLSSMFLTGIYLTLSRYLGWLSDSNLNFWLLLVITIGVGWQLGKKIYCWEGNCKDFKFPKIQWKHQFVGVPQIT